MPPHLLVDRVAAQRLAVAGHEEGQQVELGGRKVDFFAVEGAGAGRRVEHERPVLHPPRLRGPVHAAQEGLDARQKLVEGKRLGEVVVRPGPEAPHPVLHGVEGGEHQDRQLGAVQAQALAHLQPGQIGETDVQQHEVDAALPGVVEPTPAGLDPAHLVPLFVEPLLHERGDVGLVLDKQKMGGVTHRRGVRWVTCRCTRVVRAPWFGRADPRGAPTAAFWGTVPYTGRKRRGRPCPRFVMAVGAGRPPERATERAPGLALFGPGSAVPFSRHGAGKELASATARAILLLLVELAVRAVLVWFGGGFHVVQGIHLLLAPLFLGVREARQVGAVRRRGRAFAVGAVGPTSGAVGAAPAGHQERATRAHGPGEAERAKKLSSGHRV
ncbi:hypothetical protein SRM_03046 [Salinibacter ruber M8]|uniref:Uncharacterized protein n=1 Tax=Salinibacter ruber (strain M8) TaxID=761659 RepID=D5HD62_SALRM|nr:hypothetical protein SRM_03046 [Salinibacter ruber M8]